MAYDQVTVNVSRSLHEAMEMSVFTLQLTPTLHNNICPAFIQLVTKELKSAFPGNCQT